MTTGRPTFPNPLPSKRALAKTLRAEPTVAERRLWRALKDRLPLTGTHFRRQVSLGPYIADFCCLSSRLIVEVDGNQHGLDAAKNYDAVRDRFLAKQGFRVLRFSNHDVTTALDSVLDTLFAALNEKFSVPHHPTPQGDQITVEFKD